MDQPLGASPTSRGINFAVVAPNATRVRLCLFDASNSPLQEVEMSRAENGTWHCLAVGLPRKGILYGYRVSGEGGWETPFRWDDSRVLLDPYATRVAGRARFGVRDAQEQFEPSTGSSFRGTYDFDEATYDWQGVESPNLDLKDLIIYEVPVRTFTAAASSRLPEAERGTFAGLAAKADFLKDLGVNAVELLPVFEYDELEFQRSSNPRDHMVNIWGYSHLNFFAPMSRFSAAGGPHAAAREFKDMVRALHSKGIEVILDVVYNHTAEGGDDDPYVLSWRGLDASMYYQQDAHAYQRLLNWSGTGNTVAGNHPVVQRQILDSLRWWVQEYHVDGFRFDLAPCLCRGSHGEPLEEPPLIRAISLDPVLSKVKLIAEPWDLGLYMVGSFPNWDVWSEWNGRFRDDVRRFLRGEGGMKQAFATRLAGSADLYRVNARRPDQSINFVIAHDGFTLADAVTYNAKHNEANGERNCDGTNDNFTWNCGAEGPTDDPAVEALRQRQRRNIHLALMAAQGTPMVLAGDEYGQTREGNNNWYGHDGPLTHYDWDALRRGQAGEDGGWFRFYRGLLRMRAEHPLLGRREFLSDHDVTWHEAHWDDPESRFLAYTLHDRGQGGGDLYVAFNSHSFAVEAALPALPADEVWKRVVDTNLPSPRDFVAGGNRGVGGIYRIQGNSSILLLRAPKVEA
ncbi:hypothetical protein H632_c1029p0 [Helicosporidium sp. ATCC 50920]|nr:hypothetical protein H632_c1029p0 [Helicosporidium sp. ATCC 50920]|eukprot:KDD74857.1 hypothetical protein H632_c1029p0 [Helicosporidium sp. ATCC 50920]